MKRKIALFLSIVMILSIMMTGCGTTQPAGESKPAGETSSAAPAESTGVELDVMHRFADEPYKGFFESVIADYEAKTGVKCNLTFTATDPYAEKLTILMSSDNPPDVFFSFAGEFLNKFIREGLVYDLADEYNSNKDWQEAWNPALLEPFWQDEHLYGLDYDLTIKLFFYNIDIFNQYGLEAPQTWDELLSVCETLKSNGVLPISEGDSDQWPGTHFISILFHVMVPEEVRKVDYNPATGEWTDPSYIKALNMYTELSKYMNDDVVSITHSTARMAFANGESAMAYLESIEMTDVEKDGGGKLNYGMFKFPQVEGAPGNQNMLLGSPEGFSMSAACDNPKEALELMYFITSKEVGQREAEELLWFNAATGLDLSNASQKLQDNYKLLMETEGLVNWIDNECHTLLRDVFYARTQEFLNGTLSAEDYMKLCQQAAAEAKAEVAG